MGKSSAVIADSVRSGRPILHFDLMGVGSEPEVTERFRWAWQVFVQHASRGFWKGVTPELSATIPGTGVGVKIGGSSAKTDPASWGDVLLAFDKEIAKTRFSKACGCNIISTRSSQRNLVRGRLRYSATKSGK